MRQTAAYSRTNYNSPMKLAPILFLGFSLFSHAVIAQDASKAAAPSQPEPKSVTVPVTLDHNRVVIDVYLPLADGSTKRVRGWVDTGNSDLWMSRRVATLLGLTVDCGEKTCSATGSLREMVIGGMKVSFANLKPAKIMVKSDQAQDVMIRVHHWRSRKRAVPRHEQHNLCEPGKRLSAGSQQNRQQEL